VSSSVTLTVKTAYGPEPGSFFFKVSNRVQT
jgi:hypothetical protein